MNGSIHMLGASGEGLKNQVLAVRVNSIDGAKLRREIVKAGESETTAGVIAALLMAGTESAPKFLVDAAIPMAERELRDRFGVDLKITAADAPPPARKRSEFLPGLAVGAGAAAIVFGVGWSVWVGLAALIKRVLVR